jgi:hypothetical protein
VEWADRIPNLATEYLAVDIVHREAEERTFTFHPQGNAAAIILEDFRGKWNCRIVCDD